MTHNISLKMRDRRFVAMDRL